MSIELTRDDLAAIRNALGERHPIDERDEAIYRAGLAAGMERAAAALDSTNPQLRPSGCAIVIRAPLNPRA